ncbi:MAG: endonuclease/exonuclease/phosphatase family protein [Verrucomicrobiales bacterium]|nr:endonuclease/exonuclease/phosphatase family protein [Verrucomicrobiales bacterium]
MRRVFGPAVFLGLIFWGIRPSSSASAEEPAASVCFCAYNVRNWLVMSRYVDERWQEGQPKPESEKAAVIEILKKIQPDVLGICEIGTRADLEEIQSRLRTAGIALPHLHFAQGGDENRRLGLLSRFPITATVNHEDLRFDQEGHTFPMQRGILDATLTLPNGNALRCLGVHLKSKRQIPEADEALLRRNEAHLVRRLIETLLAENPGLPLLLYGDFNEHRNEPPMKALIGARTSPTYMEDLPLVDRHGEVWTHFWDSADSYSRFDYCLVSRGLKPWVNKGSSYIYQAPDFDSASDHRPIVVQLDSPGTKRSAKSGKE